MPSMILRILLVVCVAASTAPAQKYSGPRPPKPDVPYLLHASNLVETEQSDAKEEKRKDDSTYVISGVSSTARTPLAEPIFLMESRKLSPERLKLFRLEVRNGHREITFSGRRRRDANKPIFLSVTRVAEGLYRLEANEVLPNGQYSLSPDDSNQVFCFEVY
jgi:hypothetical protein